PPPAGSQSRLTAHVKEVMEKVLPPVDDDLAKAASEFSTLEELHAEIEGRLRSQLEAELENQFRAAAADALVEATNVEVAHGPLPTRSVQLWNALVRSLERRGISAEAYLQLANRTPQEIQADSEAEARQSLGRGVGPGAAGEYDALRTDPRMRRGLDRIAAETKRIPMELARARDQLWTPEKEKPEIASKLWTPGSKEPA